MRRARARTSLGRFGSSSAGWLRRHVGDKYVKAAVSGDLRSRSAFKLLEMNDKYEIVKANSRVLDLGAAPGGWSLTLRDKVVRGGRIVAVDLLEMAPIQGVDFVRGDFTLQATQQQVSRLLPAIDVILSDALMNTSGHRDTDHFRSMELVEAILVFAEACPRPLPTLLAKYYRGGEEATLLRRCRSAGYANVRTIKPDASRKESREVYLLCKA